MHMKHDYQYLVMSCVLRQKADLGCFPGFWLMWLCIGWFHLLIQRIPGEELWQMLNKRIVFNMMCLMCPWHIQVDVSNKELSKLFWNSLEIPSPKTRFWESYAW